MAYLKPPHCAYGLKGEDDLNSFIRNDLGVVDIPFLIPVDVSLFCLKKTFINNNYTLINKFIKDAI